MLCIFVSKLFIWCISSEIVLYHKQNINAHSFSPETASNYFTTRDKIEDKKRASGNKLTTSGRFIIISVLCFILILVIFRELLLCCQFPQPTGKRTDIICVYADIAKIDSVRVERKGCCSGTP